MKRINLLIALIVFTLSSWAQSRMELAFTASPSINWMNTSNQFVNSQKAVLGYDFGINGDIFFSENENYSLITGLHVVNSGGSLTYRTDVPFSFAGFTVDQGSQIRYRLRYMEVPMAIKLKTNQFNGLFFWGQFGLSAMVNIGAKGESSDGSFRRANINEEVNMFNLAMNVGAGVDFVFGTNK